MFRSKLFISLFSLLLLFSSFGVLPAQADEYDDAKVAFGAFDDGLYDFARQELERFLINYPESKMLERVRLVLILCSLESDDCRRAAALFADLKKPSGINEFGIDPAALKLRLGRCLLLAGEEKGAREFFKKLVKDHSQSSSVLPARFELARLFFAEKNFVAADRVVSPLIVVLQSDKQRVPQVDRQTAYWVAVLSRYQLKKFKTCLPLLKVMVEDPKSFPLVSGERQDLYAITIESAWHCKKPKIIKAVLQKWLQIPEAELESGKLSAALQLAADLLQAQGRLADIRGELAKVVRFDIPKADKIALYGLLIEIDRKNEDGAALEKWLEAVIPLEQESSLSRVNHLQSLLLFNYQKNDFAGTVAAGRRLLKEDKNFWKSERFYFPFLNSLGRLDKCDEIVKYVPALLPPYDKTASPGQRRYFLDMVSGSCLQKLERFEDAVAFYRLLYDYYSDSLTRVKLLGRLHSLVGKINERQKLNDWISAEVIACFSLDKRENEKLLREFPELVLLVADHFFRAQLYAKAQPSLLWLEKLDLKGDFADRVTFLLAEAYYRCEDLAEALVRYQALSTGDSKEFRYLAALRLVAIYEAQGYHSKMIKLYKNLLLWERDPAVKAELKRKLEALEATGH